MVAVDGFLAMARKLCFSFFVLCCCFFFGGLVLRPRGYTLVRRNSSFRTTFYFIYGLLSATGVFEVYSSINIVQN